MQKPSGEWTLTVNHTLHILELLVAMKVADKNIQGEVHELKE